MMRCPKCRRGRVMQQVSVYVEVPAECRNLSKSGIRSKTVTIKGVGWDMATWFCDRGCGFVNRLNAERNRS